MSVTMAKINETHLSQVVSVHMRSFPAFFLTFLGPRFLKEFYRSFTYDQQGIGFVAMEDDKVLGVVVGPLDPAGYFKRLLVKKWYAFCFASIGAVLRKPSVAKRLLRAVFYRGPASQEQKRSLLSSIAVAPEAQGRSVGRALVSKWLEEIKSRGAKGAVLTTDAEDNDKVNSFYRNLGWQLESACETPEGRKMNRYVFDFEESKA